MKPKISRELRKRIKRIKAKRPRTVLDHILRHGYITTEALREKYGYDHPPRAARDVREQGIRLETFKVKSKSGRSIAAYRLDLRPKIQAVRWGRRQFPRKLKHALLEDGGPQCTVCGGEFHPTYLQVNHKVPYEVAGESESERTEALMLLCASCNRTKSWACEHCKNWLEIKNPELCKSCYWGEPSSYRHVAMVDIRRADVAWIGDEVKSYDKLLATLAKSGRSIQELIKEAVLKLLK